MTDDRQNEIAAPSGTSEIPCSTCITDFLKTKRSKDELRVALDVLREFKGCESMEEWVGIMFSAWAKLEQLEEFLDHLVNGAELREDTKRYARNFEKAPPHVLSRR
jgi:hypothetical protein